jgi:hypothetical protein
VEPRPNRGTGHRPRHRRADRPIRRRPGDAQASATAILEADTDLRNVVVDVGTTGGVVTVTVTGDAPGIIRGTANALSVTSAVPVEELTP